MSRIINRAWNKNRFSFLTGKPYSIRLAVFLLILSGAAWGMASPAGAEKLYRPARIEYAKPRQIGVVSDSGIVESSGLARSIVNPGAFWTHNDSGDGPRLFLIDHSGKTLARAHIKGAGAVDWEDIASYRVGDKGFLLIGDVGDNAVARARLTLYIVPEPRVDTKSGSGEDALELSIAPSITIAFRYADGPRNCESVGVDAPGKTIYLVAKAGGSRCNVYSLALPEAETGGSAVARPIATLDIPVTTAMDISPDGLRAVVLTYGHAREYARRPDEPWSKAFARKERIIVMPRREQGESICYGADGKTLYLTSEGKSQPLWEVRPIPADSP